MTGWFPALKLHLEIALKCDSSVVRYFDWKHTPSYCVWCHAVTQLKRACFWKDNVL